MNSFLGDLKGYLSPTVTSPYPGMEMEAKQAIAQQSAAQDQSRKEAGYSKPYRALAPIAEGLGVNASGMEESARQGDVGGVLGHAAAPLAVMGATRAVEGIPSFERAKAALTTEVYPRVGQNVVDVSVPSKTFSNLLNRPAGQLLPPQVRSALGEFVYRMSPTGDPYRFQDLHELTSDLNDYIFSKEGKELPSKTRALLQQGVQETRESLNSAANSAGVGKPWQSFNKEWSRASKIQSAANWAGGTAGGLTGGFLGYEAGKQFGVPGYFSGPAGAAAGGAAGKAAIGGMVRSVLKRPGDVTTMMPAPPTGNVDAIMQMAKDGLISPGEADRRIARLGQSVKVNPLPRIPY
jgi:outer membrane lipoprotein SlyB